MTRTSKTTRRFGIIVNDDQHDATILAYLFIPNQLYVFRAMSSMSTIIIIRELVLNLAEVIFMLKHSVKLRRYLLCGRVAADVLVPHQITYNDVILPSVLT